MCKGVHCVDLGESFQTHIFLQNFVSIQPRSLALQSLWSDPEELEGWCPAETPRCGRGRPRRVPLRHRGDRVPLRHSKDRVPGKISPRRVPNLANAANCWQILFR